MLKLVRVVFFSLLMFSVVTLLIPYLILDREQSANLAFIHIIGIAPIFCGIALYIWCCLSFWTKGRGTPVPVDPPKTLVVQGPYRLVRNPMFVAVILILMGEVILLYSYSLLKFTIGFCVATELLVRFYEEPILRNKFGDAYRSYCASVGRWIPRKVRT